MYDLKLIKKYYGEKMMHLCRELFPTILETPGLLLMLIDNTFAHNKFLYDDIISNNLKDKFKCFIYNLIEIPNEEILFRKETPEELLKEAGYKLYECKKKKDIQSFKRYYRRGEKLCTFKDQDRLSDNYVFFAVKENVDEIKREDFINPERQDLYGTSVISIQFTKGDINTLSIKNRYNHTVDNPDATFSNNLENIMPGLTKSFERYYNLNINQNNSDSFELPNYVLANDGKLYKYNYEIDNIYYCPDNTIIDAFDVRKYEKEKYIVADYFIIDLVNKSIKFYDIRGINDSFVEDLIGINKIEVFNDKESESKIIEIFPNNGDTITIKLNKFNQIVEYENNNIQKLNWGFLRHNTSLRKLIMNNLVHADDSFLLNNLDIKYLCLPNLVEVGTNFLFKNYNIEKVDFPNLLKVGGRFMSNCRNLTEINFPKLRVVGYEFLAYNSMLKEGNFPELEIVKDRFLFNNEILSILNCPKIKQFGNDCLMKNVCIEEIYFPKLFKVGDNFMYYNMYCLDPYFPNLTKKGRNFFFMMNYIKEREEKEKIKKLKKAN